MRLFVGLWPSREAVEVLRGAQAALRRPELRSALRFPRPEQLHLTLRFLGEVADARVPDLEAALHAAVAWQPTFELALAGAGCFPGPARPRVVWVGLRGGVDELGAVQARVADACTPFAAAPEDHGFSPHLTIARVREVGRRERAALAEVLEELRIPAPAAWLADHVRLVRSELRPDGPVYTTVASMPLPTMR